MMCRVVLTKITAVYLCDSDGVLYPDETELPRGLEVDVDLFSHTMRVTNGSAPALEELAVHRLLIDGAFRGQRILAKDIADLLPQNR